MINKFSGYFRCKSIFGEYHQTCDNLSLQMNPGINYLLGDIDSGCWALSYALSFQKNNKKSIIFSGTPNIVFRNVPYSIEDLQKLVLYVDKQVMFFSKRKTVKKQIEENLRKNNFLQENSDEIRELFHISDFRYDKQISGVGNEIFKCLSAIGYSNEVSVFCFPWLSVKQIKYYGENLTSVLRTLSDLNKIVLFPTNCLEYSEKLKDSISGIFNFNNI